MSGLIGTPPDQLIPTLYMIFPSISSGDVRPIRPFLKELREILVEMSQIAKIGGS